MAPKADETTVWLPLTTLRFDPRVNRGVEASRVTEIAANFDPDAFGVAEVSERSDGSYVVIDAQHRISALLEMGWQDQRVECKVHRGLSVKAEAALALKLNNTKAWSPLEKFKKRIESGEKVAVAINDIVETCGYVIDGAPSDGHIACVAALETIYTGRRFAADQVQPKVLHDTLTIATEAWGRTKHAVSGHIVTALGQVLHQYGSQIERETMVAKLAAYPGGPGRLLGGARGLRDSKPWSVADCAASIIVDTYNRQRRVGKLPEWRRS